MSRSTNKNESLHYIHDHETAKHQGHNKNLNNNLRKKMDNLKKNVR